MTPSQREYWEVAKKLTFRADVIRQGVAMTLIQDCDVAEMISAGELLKEAIASAGQASEIFHQIREAQDAAEDAEEEIEPTRGRPLQ